MNQKYNAWTIFQYPPDRWQDFRIIANVSRYCFSQWDGTKCKQFHWASFNHVPGQPRPSHPTNRLFMYSQIAATIRQHPPLSQPAYPSSQILHWSQSSSLRLQIPLARFHPRPENQSISCMLLPQATWCPGSSRQKLAKWFTCREQCVKQPSSPPALGQVLSSKDRTSFHHSSWNTPHLVFPRIDYPLPVYVSNPCTALQKSLRSIYTVRNSSITLHITANSSSCFTLHHSHLVKHQSKPKKENQKIETKKEKKKGKGVAERNGREEKEKEPQLTPTNMRTLQTSSTLPPNISTASTARFITSSACRRGSPG